MKRNKGGYNLYLLDVASLSKEILDSSTPTPAIRMFLTLKSPQAQREYREKLLER
jgi:hypothetical protein